MEIDDLHVTVASVNQLASIPEDGGQIVIIHEEVVTDDEDCFHGGLQDTVSLKWLLPFCFPFATRCRHWCCIFIFLPSFFSR